MLVPIRSVCAGSCVFGMCGVWEGLFVGCRARSLRSGRVRFVGPQRSRVWVCLRFSAFVSGVSLGSACRSRMWGCGVCGPRRAFCLPPLPAHRSSVVPLLTGLHSRPPPPLAIGIPRPSPSSRLRSSPLLRLPLLHLFAVLDASFASRPSVRLSVVPRLHVSVRSAASPSSLACLVQEVRRPAFLVWRLAWMSVWMRVVCACLSLCCGVVVYLLVLACVG